MLAPASELPQVPELEMANSESGANDAVSRSPELFPRPVDESIRAALC